ncbi:MAG: helix-turn-helix domain-containing protein [Candidatus Paceibacterota bacterium]
MGTVNSNSKVSLTEAGKDLHDNGRMDGTEVGEVLVYLNDSGDARVFDIADAINMGDSGVASLVQQMVKEGWAQITG